MADPEKQPSVELDAACALYGANLATMRWIEQRTLTVTLQVVTLDLVLSAAALTSNVRLSTPGRALSGLLLAVLHAVIWIWLSDQRRGHKKREAQMRDAHRILRRTVGKDDGPAGGKAPGQGITWGVQRAVLCVAGVTAFVAALWPGLLTR